MYNDWWKKNDFYLKIKFSTNSLFIKCVYCVGKCPFFKSLLFLHTLTFKIPKRSFINSCTIYLETGIPTHTHTQNHQHTSSTSCNSGCKTGFEQYRHITLNKSLFILLILLCSSNDF